MRGRWKFNSRDESGHDGSCPELTRELNKRAASHHGGSVGSFIFYMRVRHGGSRSILEGRTFRFLNLVCIDEQVFVGRSRPIIVLDTFKNQHISEKLKCSRIFPPLSTFLANLPWCDRDIRRAVEDA